MPIHDTNGSHPGLKSFVEPSRLNTGYVPRTSHLMQFPISVTRLKKNHLNFNLNIL